MIFQTILWSIPNFAQVRVFHCGPDRLEEQMPLTSTHTTRVSFVVASRRHRFVERLMEMLPNMGCSRAILKTPYQSEVETSVQLLWPCKMPQNRPV